MLSGNRGVPADRYLRRREGTATTSRSTDRMSDHGSKTMLDVLMLLIGLGFFAVAIGYVFFCEKA
jgi:hypothetical protein